MQTINTSKNHTYNMAVEVQISQLHAQIRSNPSKAEYRIHLVQLLMITGQWEKSLHQLQTATQLDSKSAAMAHTYRALIQAEVQREHIFKGLLEPQYLQDAEPWQVLLAEAQVAHAHQQPIPAEKFRHQAYADAPACAFVINDTPVHWIADGDSRLGPVCEAYINGNYYWIPFNKIQQLNIEKPQDLRDLVWIPASITLTDFSQHFGFLPSRYVFSYNQNNDQLSLAALTEWQPFGKDSWIGLGQKMLVAEKAEYPLLAIRTLTQTASE